MKNIIALLLLFLAACGNNNKQRQQDSTNQGSVDTPALATKQQPLVATHTDTLQFIHFDGNLDYWYAYFINAKKDTLRLVTDQTLTDRLLGKLLQAKWQDVTLTEAGDGERPYQDKRLISFKEIAGSPFAQPFTEQMAKKAIEDLEEVKANADRLGVSEKPTADKRYYQVETSTEADGNISRFYTFRVYFYPAYQIKIFNPADDTEMSLDEWRANK